MQSRVTSAGPLVAGSATKIAASQSPVGAGALALNGPAGTAVANNISLSQSGTAATALLLNGALGQTPYVALGMTAKPKVALLSVASPIYITSAGNDAAITYAVVGLDINNGSISETVKGTNAGISASLNSFKTIVSITPSGNTASTVTVGSMGFVTLDMARQVIFTSGGADTGITITITGTDWSGSPISETVTGGSGSAVATILDYLTITQVKVSGATATTITVGTNGVAGSPWVNLDTWANGTVEGQCAITGTANFTVFVSNDDPDSYGNPIARTSVFWDSTQPNIIAGAVSVGFGLAYAPAWAKVVLNSGSGSVRMTLNQHSAVPY